MKSSVSKIISKIRTKDKKYTPRRTRKGSFPALKEKRVGCKNRMTAIYQ
ncbi:MULTISPECIES: hypothetical protein [Desulfovibrio]|uniref:Uncharacterized protein n=1 Tax=Desulfovibrio piger TaxID=901 RepID=A0A848CBL8_9BACT|nr:hypothetical protein [Desulfovibrio piger]NME52632.1 hypothetical protein [Desulfovibrio piger]